jgi:hypothetical protein
MAVNQIQPIPEHPAHSSAKCHIYGLSSKQITQILGFKPNVFEDPTKVRFAWGFLYKGQHYGVWDYRGSWRDKCYSFSGPRTVAEELFATGRVVEAYSKEELDYTLNRTRQS